MIVFCKFMNSKIALGITNDYDDYDDYGENSIRIHERFAIAQNCLMKTLGSKFPHDDLFECMSIGSTSKI